MGVTRRVTLDQAHETRLTLANAGATSDWWVRVAQDLDMAKAVVDLVKTWDSFSLNVPSLHTEAGWTCDKPVMHKGGRFEPYLLDVNHLSDRGMTGEILISRANPDQLTGLAHAEAMVQDQRKIPVSWREDPLVFPEVWGSPKGHHYVPCLTWRDEIWLLSFLPIVANLVRRHMIVSDTHGKKSD